MAKLRFKAGATGITVYVFLQDDTATDGSGKTGLAFGDVTFYYVQTRDNPTSRTLVNILANNSDHTPDGFRELDSTNMPGVYRLDINDVVLANAPGVTIALTGSGFAPVVLEFQLDDTSELPIAGVPAIDADLPEMIKWIYTLSRNKIEQTTSQQTLRNDADTGTIGTSGTNDDTTTFTRDTWS